MSSAVNPSDGEVYYLVRLVVAELELGLRWLHDRASRCGCGYVHDTWCTNPVLSMRGPLQALELGLRWLHDRANELHCTAGCQLEGYDTCLHYPSGRRRLSGFLLLP